MQSKVFIIAGSESSGNKLLYKILSMANNIKKVSHDVVDEWEINKITYNKDTHLVCFRSLPSYPKGTGKRRFTNILDLYKNLEKTGYLPYIIIPVRDPLCVEKSKTRNHTKNKEISEEEINIAKKQISAIIKSNVRSFIFSYETFMFIGRDYLYLLSSFIEEPLHLKLSLINGNRKYIKR